MFLLWIREPVLPQNSSNLFGRLSGKRIGGEQGKNVWFAIENAALRLDHERVFAPITERCEPEIPFESRLIRNKYTLRNMGILRLISKGESNPHLTVMRPLEFNFVTTSRHHHKQAVFVCNPKWSK